MTGSDLGCRRIPVRAEEGTENDLTAGEKALRGSAACVPRWSKRGLTWGGGEEASG